MKAIKVTIPLGKNASLKLIVGDEDVLDHAREDVVMELLDLLRVLFRLADLRVEGPRRHVHHPPGQPSG